MSNQNLKFRPVLNIEQMTRIADLVSQSQSSLDLSIKRIVVVMLAKIEVGAINPAYRLSEIHAQKLSDLAMQRRYENDEMTPEEASHYESTILGV